MSKPAECEGCPLEPKNPSFALHDGPVDAPLLVMAEALGKEEAAQSKHLVGPSGTFHWKQAKRAGFLRDQVRVGNVISCRPPDDWLAYAPWEEGAISHCRVHREPLLEEPHNAILTLGVTATREVCKYYNIDYYGTLDHWHGYVIGDGTHPWIIPTFHPANLLRGQFKYTGVYIHDLSRAWEVATKGFTRSKVDLIADPDVGWFMKWAEQITEDTWLGVDIETPEPIDSSDPADPSWRVLYVNLSYNLDEGISVPFEGPYIPVLKGILERCRMQWYWNAFYDVPRLKRYDIRIPWYWDAKDAWHVLQSDMGADDKDPRDKSKKGTIQGNSLGFVAPFYSDLPPWKHEGTLSPHYRCMDGVQTLRVAHGIMADLQKQGQLEVFTRHMNLFGHLVLRPAEGIGLRVNRPKLEAFGEVLSARIASLEEEIQAVVPPEALPLKKPAWKTPPEGYQDEPPPSSEVWTVLSGEQGPGAILGRLEPGLVKVCRTCGKEGVTAAHKKCPAGTPQVTNVERLLPRWTMRLPFNPSSPDQIRTLLQLGGHDTGRSKKAKTDKMTTEAAALEKLAHKVPVLRKVLDLREVEKTDGTYVSGLLGKRGQDGVRARGRLDALDRVHSTFLEKPSTLRTSSADPNLQNVVHGDEEPDHEELPPWDPAGFRRAIEAADGCELWEMDYCVDPLAKVLLADLTWARAEQLEPGQELLAFDEDPSLNGSKFRKAKVVGTKRIQRMRVRVRTTEGDCVVSFNHPFLARHKSYRRKWVQAQDLKPGMLMTFLAKPWETDQSRDAGYLAGFFDGEGWVTSTALGYAQNPGPTLDHVQTLLEERRFAFRRTNGSSTAQCQITQGMRETLRFLGSVRPRRLLAKADRVWEGRRTWGKRTPIAEVLSIDLLPEGPVIAIETTTKTFISDGFFSHNSAIEAVLTGWFCGDPNYIRLAQAGVHAYLTAVGIGAPGIPKPTELRGWTTPDLKKLLKPFKTHPQYGIKKRVVHGVSYGLTSFGMSGLYPDLFPTPKSAQKEIDFFFSVCPMVQAWQNQVRNTAARLGFLGGAGGEGEAPHPYHYRHWFFEVMVWDSKYKRWKAGGDSNRVVAFKPQSTARGVLTEAALDMHTPGSQNYIADLYFGKTPTRALVHDSLLFECPVEGGPILHERTVRAMTAPVEALPCPPEWDLGTHLSIGVAAKRGKNWSPWKKDNPEGMKEVG